MSSVEGARTDGCTTGRQGESGLILPPHTSGRTDTISLYA